MTFTKKILITWAALAAVLFVGQVQAEDSILLVHYDRAKDTLSVPQTSAPLSDLLRKISAQSGIEIKLDPTIDQPVEVSFAEIEVSKALTSLARQYQLSYIMGHQRDSAGEDQLVSFAILKEGEMSAAGLPPLVDLQTDALGQMRDAAQHGRKHTSVRAYQRWESRFSQLPPPVRARLQENAQKNIDRAVQQETKKMERTKASEARRAEKKQIAEKSIEELKQTSPERHALKMERRAELETKASAEAEKRRQANKEARMNNDNSP